MRTNLLILGALRRCRWSPPAARSPQLHRCGADEDGAAPARARRGRRRRRPRGGAARPRRATGRSASPAATATSSPRRRCARATASASGASPRPSSPRSCSSSSARASSRSRTASSAGCRGSSRTGRASPFASSQPHERALRLRRRLRLRQGGDPQSPQSWTPREIVAIATAHPPYFAPGEAWSYSDTNYFLLGLIVEAATGRSLASELGSRIIAPLRLRATSLPTAPRIAGRHAHGYFLRPLTDVSVGSPSVDWAAGGIVSNAGRPRPLLPRPSAGDSFARSSCGDADDRPVPLLGRATRTGSVSQDPLRAAPSGATEGGRSATRRSPTRAETASVTS